MSLKLSRRRFLALSGVAVLGATGYGATRAVRSVRNAAARMSSQ
jgi:hypothetical protein